MGKAFTDREAMELGRAILDRFEAGLNGNEWQGRSVVLPIQLRHPFNSAIEMRIPYFVRRISPTKSEHITLNEWLKECERG